MTLERIETVLMNRSALGDSLPANNNFLTLSLTLHQTGKFLAV
jgi:hypothetical protein